MSYSILRQVCIALLVLAAVASLLPVAAWAATGPNNFHTVSPSPCRLYDTRPGVGTNNPLVDDAPRLIQVTGNCGVPGDAKSVILNVTLVPVDPPDTATDKGELFLYPSDGTKPQGGFPFPPNKTKAKVDIVELASNVSGKIAALAEMTVGGEKVHLILDVNGYFMDSAGPVNDPVTVNEDSGATTLDVRGNDNGPPGGGPFIIDSVTQPANGTVVITNSGADLTYEPDADYCNNPPGTLTDNFTYGVTPGHSTPSDSTATVAVKVNCVNDAPAGTDGTVSTSENTDYVFTAADFGFTDPLDVPANALLAVKITTLPAAGSLKLSGGAVSAGQSIAVADITAGNLKFSPATDANGSPYTSFTFQVQDDGGTANSGVDLDTTPNTLTINVTGVNNPPAGTDGAVSTPEDTQYTFAAADFGFTDPLDTPANNLASVVITTLPGLGSLTLSGSGFAAGTEIAVADITAGNLKYSPVTDAIGSPYTTFTFQVRDDGGTAGGGVDLDASANTLTINVTGVNDAPAGADNAVSTPEDVQYTFAAADFGFTDPIDSPANALQAVKITTLPAAGTLTLSGSGFVVGTDIAVADITAGNLKFTPAANAIGSPYTTFTFQVRDDGGTASGGVDLDPTPNTITVNVTAVNDAPAGTNNAVNTLEETQYTFTAADFGFTDPNDTPANALASVVITTLPGAGSLTLSGSGFAAGTEISLANITAGNLKFTPAANGSGSPYTTFTFQVRDDGGTVGGGVDLDQTPNTLSVNVAGVNDAPAGTNNSVAATEDAQYTFTVADFGFTDPSDSPANALASVVITTLPGAGTLTLSGSGFAAGTEISAANITAGNLKFAPAANGSGSPYTTFTFQVRDDGGTANSGVDLDPSANTLTVNVTAVNDAPAGTNNAVAALEDAQYTFTAADFGFTDPNDSPANALASVVITTLPGAGTLTLSGSGFAAGTDISVANINGGNLKFTPAANGSGSPYTAFTFQVRDNGGTASGGVDLDPTPNTLTVNVTAINDAPAGTNNTVATLEETQYTFTAADFGFTDPNDSPANALASVVITTLPGTGSLTLSGSGFAAGTEISVANITAGNLKFTPAGNGSGSPYTTFTFQVRDDGGTANGGVNLDASANTMTVNVAAVNDAPAGTNGAVAAVEDAQYTFTAANFGFTDPNDSPANALASVVITTLPGAGTLTLSGSSFAAGTEIPVASINGGNLKFTPAANGSGSPYTTFTFQVRDDGGTANGGVDLDPTPNTMTVNVTAVNDAPAGTDKTVTTDEDVPYTFTAADFGFTDPNDSPANALASVVISTLPGAGSLTLSGGGFAAGTEISLANITAGNLKFLGAANAFGSPYASFTFQVRDNGGTASGGVDLDPTPNTITVNVTPVNDAPTFGDATIDYSTVGNTQLRAGEAATGASVVHVRDNLDVVERSSPSDIDGPAPPFIYSLGTAPANGQATVNGDGTFTYEPNPGFAGPTDSFTVNVSDGGVPAGVSAVTVTVAISEMVWYVHDVVAPTNPNNPAAGDDGRSTNAFEILQDAITAAGPDDYVFVFRGNTGTTPHAPATLLNKNGLKLIGQGIGLSVPGFPGLVPAGAEPNEAVIQNAAATAGEDNALQVTINAGTVDNVEIRGFAITATDNAIDVTVTGAATAGVRISENEIGTTAAEGIDVNHGSTSTTSTLAVHDNVLLTGGNAIDITRTNGTLKITAFDDNVVSGNTNGSGIVVNGPSVIFDSDPGTAALDAVSGGNTSIGASGNPVANTGLALSQVSGSLSFTDLDIFAGGTSGSALVVGGTGAFTGLAGTSLQVTPAAPDGLGTSMIDSDNGAALDITSATIDLRLADMDSNTSTTGLNLNTVGGQFRAPSGSAISKTSGGGTAFTVASSSATVNYAGTLNVTSGGGVSLTGNTGAVNFSGLLTLKTGANVGFSATGGGTVTATGSGNSIKTTSGTALTVSGTTIGAAGLSFDCISAGRGDAGVGGGPGCTQGDASGTPANGIFLNSTGTGVLTVNGDGSNTSLGGNSSGGIIQNTTGSTGSTGGIGVYVNNARATLRRMNIHDHPNYGIFGGGSTVFNLEYSTVNSTATATSTNGDAASADDEEGSVAFEEWAGSGTITSSIIGDGFSNNLRVLNTNGADLNRLTVSNSRFDLNGQTAGNDQVHIESRNSGTTLNFTLTGSTVKGARADWLNASANSSSTMDTIITGNTFTNISPDNHPATVANGNRLLVSANATHTFEVANNTLKGSLGNALAITGAAGGAVMTGDITNNDIGDAATANSGSTGAGGISVQSGAGADITVLIDGNDVRQYNNHGIIFTLGDQMGNAATINATLTNNTTNTPGTLLTDFNGFHVNSGTVSTDNLTSCFNIHDNNFTGGGKGSVAPNNSDVRLRQRQGTTIQLPGYTGPARDNGDLDVAEVITYLRPAGSGGLKNNTFGTGNANSVSTGGGYVNSAGGAVCPTPP